METVARDGPSLLLIEESDVILNSLRDWLTMAFPDVRLIETTHRGNAVTLNRSQSPDVVLMDISNLGRGGVESVRTVKAAQPTALIFALISLDHASYRQAVMRAGAEGCAPIWKLRTELLPQLREHLSAPEDNGHADHDGDTEP